VSTHGVHDPAELWRALARSVERACELIPPDAGERERAEALQYLAHFLDAGLRLCVTHADPERPSFVRFVEPQMTWGLDHPDCNYHHAEIRGGAEYRISGRRGSANHLDVQVNHGHFANGALDAWGTIASLSGRELVTAGDGAFEIFVTRERRGANWLATRDDAEFVLVRQYFGDWERERPADLRIERIGGELAPASIASAAELARRLQRLETWLAKGGALWSNMSRLMRKLPPNTLNIANPQAAAQRAGLAGQAYGIGNFRCDPDEALIVEFIPPPCHHWTIALANPTWESIDVAARQSSLNHHQARLTAGGVFRGVIAHADPGVANWLDTSGLVSGTLSARFLLAQEAPKPSLSVARFENLERELASDTPRVTAAERRNALIARRRGIENRFRS
jgi:hypothetical protein